MRSLVFASLCKDASSQEALDILRDLANAPSKATNSVWSKAQNLLTSQYRSAPKILDMFGGGGTIPMEASALGADAYACDANELSVFVQRCNAQYSQRFDTQKLVKTVRHSGSRVLNQLAEETAPLFPLRKYNLAGPDPSSVFGYLWSYSMECTECNYRFYLSKRRWLSKKRGNNLALVFDDNGERERIEIKDLPNKKGRLSSHLSRSGKATCPNCGFKHENVTIDTCRDELVGLIKLSESVGKEFLPSSEEALPEREVIQDIERETLDELGIELPQSQLPRWSGIVNPALYGMSTHADFLNPRQRAVLLLLIKSLRDEYVRLCEEEKEDLARCVVGFLSSLVDQVIDWNCRLSMWISQNEQVGRAFSGPGVAMLWDYAETDQLLQGPANLWSKLKRIVKGVKSIPQLPGRVDVRQAFAQNLPYEDNTFDAVVTDPPYYDNIYYSVLADFFYVWKRPILDMISPSEAPSSEVTNSDQELVASKERSGTSEQAHEDYCEQLTQALREAARVLKPNGVFSFVYGHGSLQGWEAVVRAYRNSDLLITSAQPLSIERRQRPRAMTSEAKNTCIAFIARHSRMDKPPITLEVLKENLREHMAFACTLVDTGWKEDDAGMAAFANAVGELANSNGVKGMSDLCVLQELASAVQSELASFSVKSRKSL